MTLSPDLDLSTVDLATEVVRTERLVLRPYRPDDEDAVFEACQDPEIQRWLSVLPVPYSREDARVFVAEVAPRERAEAIGMPVAIEADGVLVGFSGVHLRPGRLGPEIGYWSKDPRAPRPSQARAGTLHAGRGRAGRRFQRTCSSTSPTLPPRGWPDGPASRRKAWSGRAWPTATAAGPTPSCSPGSRATDDQTAAVRAVCCGSCPFCGTSTSRISP